MVQITQKRLKELLNYDPKTGIFTWKVNRSRTAKKGNIAGSEQHGYINIQIHSKTYKAHRLAWLYVYGYFPENEIDHINRIGIDNKIKNLREISHTCNMRNCGNRKNNTSGIKGIHFCKLTNKWVVQIYVNKKKKWIGRFKNFDEAVCHRLAIEQCLNYQECDYQSPAYKYVQKMLYNFKDQRRRRISC